MPATSSRTDGPIASAPPRVVWRLIDGKPGHENQSLGLVQALGRLVPLQTYDIALAPGRSRWLDLLACRCPGASHLPAPDLLVGAGHATHAALLVCSRQRGGRSVVLMRPSLPRRWFDLCIVPEHDDVVAASGVLVTRGVLNPLRATGERDPQQGLILIGGPSKHYRWQHAELCQQVEAIVTRDRRRWTLAGSRRTPSDTLQALDAMDADNLSVVPAADTAPGWLAEQLQNAAVAWVSEDSVSMLYEALTAGAACGVLPVAARGDNRVRRGLLRLLEDGLATTFADWQRGADLRTPPEPLHEADRCARWIKDAWLDR